MNKSFSVLIAVALAALWISQPVSAASYQTTSNPSGTLPSKTLSNSTKSGVADDSIRTTGRSGVADDSVRKYPPLKTGPGRVPPGGNTTTNPTGNPY